MTETDHRLFLKHFLPAEAVLKAYLLAATGDIHAADDLLQEVSSVLWEKFGQYDRGRPFRHWAMGIARLEILKWRQSLGRSREVLSAQVVDALAETASEHAGEADERLRHLRDCLDALAGKTRQLVQLRFGRLLAIRQVAEQLGKSVAAVEMALVRARRGLRTCIESKLSGTKGGGS